MSSKRINIVSTITSKYKYHGISFITLIIFSLVSSVAVSQNTMNFKTVESETYSAFTLSEWDSLISIGNRAIDAGIDYYYLRVRIGIAYFNKSNFRQAAKHFEKAMAFNSQDETNLEYLYYSYLYSKRIADANALVDKFSDALKQKLNVLNPKIINSVYFEAGPILSNNILKNGNKDLDMQANIYGEADFVDDVFYSHIGLRHNLNNKISLYHSYSNINIARQKLITIRNIDTLDNYFTKQNEYYINARFYLTKGLSICPAFHFINNKYKTINYVRFDTATFTDVWGTIDTNFNSSVFSLSLSYDYSIFNFGLFGSISELNKQKQAIGGASITIYPKGNLRLYTFTSFAYFKDDAENRPIFEQLVGLQCSENCWLEASATLGNMANYNEKNAFIVYNVPDNINYKIGGSLIYSLNEHIEISLRYNYMQKENPIISYDQPIFVPGSGSKHFKEIKSTYTNNSIIGGLLWKI
ncbi:MAG: hypothetical protein K9J13_06400 [Saprospiraceae bacterium]|nr:hypothetical protein [Saprospiraceae bacterium]